MSGMCVVEISFVIEFWDKGILEILVYWGWCGWNDFGGMSRLR